MARTSLPILSLQVNEQRYSCHGCGNCCRDFTVQLRDDDVHKLEAQRWAEKLGESPIVEFRGRRYLKQREDGACIFWMDDGRCRIHAEHGFEEKPIACQLFPFSLTPVASGAQMGINFACQSVLENKGAELSDHRGELSRMAAALPEVQPLNEQPLLTSKLRAEAREVEGLSRAIDRWLRHTDQPFSIRMDGLAWVVQSLASAKLENVRGRRFIELLDTLFGALPDELEYHPVAKPTRGQLKMLRQGVFARIEDPKIGRVEQTSIKRTALGQFMRSRRFAAGKGNAAAVALDWGDAAQLQNVAGVAPASDTAHAAPIDDLMTRWLRATIMGGRAWGPGFYAWPMLEGLKALVFNVAVVGWLARLHATGAQQRELTINDVRAALGRVDRTSGRAVWLGSPAETWRLKYLCADDGLRRLIHCFGLVV